MINFLVKISKKTAYNGNHILIYLSHSFHLLSSAIFQRLCGSHGFSVAGYAILFRGICPKYGKRKAQACKGTLPWESPPRHKMQAERAFCFFFSGTCPFLPKSPPPPGRGRWKGPPGTTKTGPGASPRRCSCHRSWRRWWGWT